MMSSEDKVLIKEILNMGVEDIPTKFKFNIQTTALDQTEEAKRQGMLMNYE